MEMSVARNSLCVSYIATSACRPKGARGVWQPVAVQRLLRHYCCHGWHLLTVLQDMCSGYCRIDVHVPAGYVQSFLQDMSHRNSATAPPSEYTVSDGYRSGAAGGSAKGPPSLRPVAGLWHISQARFCPDL